MNTSKLLLLPFTILALLTSPAFGGVIASSTFSNPADGTDGWLAQGDVAVEPNRIGVGGNPDGYIEVVDSVTGGVIYWLAPAKFLGNKSAAYGYTLSFDLQQSSLFNQFDDVDIMISSVGTNLVFDTTPNPGTSWTSYSVLLAAGAGWRKDTLNGTLATAEEIQAVLSNLTQLKIRGEFVTGPDTDGLDNVVLSGADAPEPGTTALGALGLMALAGRWWSRRRI